MLDEQKSSQGLEDEIFMSALQVQREQILAEAKLEIQKHEEKASFNEDYSRDLKSQIDSRGYLEASRAKDRLQQEVADNERAPHEGRLRGLREIQELKRNRGFYVDGFSVTKLQENQNTINNLMNRVRELHCEINYMHDSKDLKDVESMHSGHFHTFPMNQRYFPPKVIEEDCWAAPKLCRLIFRTRSVHRETFLPVHLKILRHPFQEYPRHGTIQMQVAFPGGPVRGNLYLEMVMKETAQYQPRDF